MDCDESIPEDDTVPDVPMILSQQLYDIFPMFASMLDIKSFMKLAMTSKDMYKRCMEDKAIRINIYENSVDVHSVAHSSFYLRSSVVSGDTKSYIAALSNPRCRVSLRTLQLCGNETESSPIVTARRCMKKLNVKRIEELVIQHMFSEWEAIFSFIKDFYVNGLHFSFNAAGEVPYPFLLSLLQLNLKKFYYNRLVPVDILFEVNSPILNLSLTGIIDIPKAKFTQILWMIQSGSLHHIIVDIDAVDWSAYDTLPFNSMQKLPEDRPLAFARTPRFSSNQDYWFLHWQGGVTKCVRDENSRTLEVFKCEPSNFPLVLRKEEDIMKDLREMRSGVSCNLKHFRKFAADFTMLDPSFKGHFPAERPLYFKASERSFWRLDEGDNLMHFNWKDGCATLKAFQSDENRIDHPALAKFMFWKLLKDEQTFRYFLSESVKEFSSWFEDCKTLDVDYTGPLSDERPLVFRGKIPTSCDVLFGGFRFHCGYHSKTVRIDRYSTWRRPSKPITAGVIKKMLQNTSKRSLYINIPVGLKTFRDGFELFKSTPCAFDLFTWKTTHECNEKLIEKCWYYAKGTIMKVIWEEGRLMRTSCDLQDSPTEFIKILFKEFARQGECKMDPIFLELKQLQSCLEQFIVVPFDYSGPLKNDYPLAFKKNEIRRTSGHVFYVWFLWEDRKMTYCSWGEKEAEKMQFFKTGYCVVNIPVPHALMTKEYLKMLLELQYEVNTAYQWFGDFADFLAFFNEYKTLPFNYKGELPEERPLVFEDNKDNTKPVRILFREDNSLIKCKWSSTRGVAFVCHPRGKNVVVPR